MRRSAATDSDATHQSSNVSLWWPTPVSRSVYLQSSPPAVNLRTSMMDWPRSVGMRGTIILSDWMQQLVHARKSNNTHTETKRREPIAVLVEIGSELEERKAAQGNRLIQFCFTQHYEQQLQQQQQQLLLVAEWSARVDSHKVRYCFHSIDLNRSSFLPSRARQGSSTLYQPNHTWLSNTNRRDHLVGSPAGDVKQLCSLGVDTRRVSYYATYRLVSGPTLIDDPVSLLLQHFSAQRSVSLSIVLSSGFNPYTWWTQLAPSEK